MGIPFIIVPLVTTLIGYLSTKIGFMPCSVIECPVGLPVFVNTFVAYSGAWQALVTVVICFVVAVALYTPFVLMANKQAQKEGK
jgi:PTS system cellobiose-specific IIC component